MCFYVKFQHTSDALKITYVLGTVLIVLLKQCQLDKRAALSEPQLN